MTRAKPGAAPPKRAPRTPAKAAKAAKAAKPARAAKPRTAAKASAGAQARTAKATGRGHHTQPRTQAPRVSSAGRKPPPPDPAAGPLGTAVQAAAELAEIGMMASARALRGALSRLPRP
ncbi:MAG: hypothetical protein ACR2GZ_00710 [Solirubrobacteraceae bacterium]